MDSTIAIFRYEEPIRTLIHELKFGNRYSVARLFARLLADRLHQQVAIPEAVIPVPLHWRRYFHRGYNQSLEISRELRNLMGITLETGLCIRVRNTQPQSDLSAKERKNNMKNAFRVAPPVTFKHVAILDDVITTSATANELAKTLKRSGVHRVDALTIARA